MFRRTMVTTLDSGRRIPMIRARISHTVDQAMLTSIENYYERLVEDKLRQLLGNGTGEPAPLDDIACLALNHLPPRYIRNRVDCVSHLTDAEREAMDHAVDKAVNFAIQAVRRRRQAREAD